MCRRGGKELLEFIERLAGTAGLKMETEEVQTVLDDLREEALGLENDVQASLHARRKLQPQVDLCFPFRDNSSIRCREHSSILATSVLPLASLQQICFTPGANMFYSIARKLSFFEGFEKHATDENDTLGPFGKSVVHTVWVPVASTTWRKKKLCLPLYYLTPVA